MNQPSLHRAQTAILHKLRSTARARYTDLRLAADLDSDVFKFHIRKLISTGLIVKSDDGRYILTPAGKEFANRLDKHTGREIQQPKASMLFVVRAEVDGVVRYLAHRRMREPFWGYWGIASAPILRGVPTHEAAARELHKQSGIVAEFRVVGLHRVIDQTPGGDVLEDKLFSLLRADLDHMPDPHAWHGGESVWQTRDELLAHPRIFPTTAKTLDMIEGGVPFAEDACIYPLDKY